MEILLFLLNITSLVKLSDVVAHFTFVPNYSQLIMNVTLKINRTA